MNLPWKPPLPPSPGGGGRSSQSLKNTKLKLLERLFSLDDNRECIAMFFKFLNHEIIKQQQDLPLTPQQNDEKPSHGSGRHGRYHGITLFCIENDINYLLTSSGCQYIVTQLIEQLSSPPHCIVIMDSYIMTKLARGLLKPMSAILGGQLKIEGDIKVFGELTPLLRASVKAMMEHNKTNFNLDVSILRTYVKTDQQNHHKHTEYVIRSIDRIGGNYWETPHRFSDFIQFRKILKESGYQNLPDLPSKLLIHSSVHPTVVRRRMEDLALFLQLIIIQVGSSDPHVVNFLGAYMSGSTQTISQLTIPTSLKKTTQDNSGGENEDVIGEIDGDDDDDDLDSFHSGLSSVDDSLKMKHALKVAQEHAEYYVHETKRKPSIVSSSFHSASFSVDKDSKSVDKNSHAGLPMNLASTLTYSTPSLPATNNSRTHIVRDEIFQLKKRIDNLESLAGDGKSLSSYLASCCLHLLPRITLWGTIFSLILGFALPLLLSSSDRVSASFSHLKEGGFTSMAIAYFLPSSVLSILTYVFAFVMITFIISMPYSRRAAAVSIVLYLLYPLLSPLLSLIFQIINSLLESDSSLPRSSPQLCGIGVYVPDQDMCSFSPTRILVTSSFFILSQIIRRKGFPELLLSWMISIPINYSLHTMKNFGIKVFPSHPLTSLLKYIMIIERLFAIYTPIATVVSAYIYLTLFLKVFGYAAPSLISGTNSTPQQLAFPDKKQRHFNDSSRNLTSSAYHALDRVLAEYVLNEICSLQSIFIKLGQYVAGRPDLVSSLWSSILSKLHDSCPVSSSLYIKTIVETCLTATKRQDEKLCNSTKPKFYSYQKKKLRSLDELFETFEMKPIVSGCIAQYHQATMIIDGQLYEVMVKVQHPTIETLFHIDMNALKTIVTVATKFYSKWKVAYPHHNLLYCLISSFSSRSLMSSMSGRTH